jgi:hypothetical protein
MDLPIFRSENKSKISILNNLSKMLLNMLPKNMKEKPSLITLNITINEQINEKETFNLNKKK